MLSEEKNHLLTRVEPGTPMGALLRRYWHPVAASSALKEGGIEPLRLLGEDLVLFRSATGRCGLIQRSCTHRLADLATGYVDGEGLRCNYHGWLFDRQGSCVQQPFEDLAADNPRFRDKCRAVAYQVEELAGLVWAYLGPEPRPVLPCFEPFTWPNGFKQIVFARVPCNWFQCQENSIDPVHFEWLHDIWGARILRGADGSGVPRHLRIAFDEFEHGFVYRRVREGSDESDPLWTVGRVCLWPNGLYTDDHIEWRVPIDTEQTLSVCWMFDRVPERSEPFEQKEIPAWTGSLRDERTGEYHTAHLMNQDFVAWVGQGTVADRTSENLGRSDRGITAIRSAFLRDMREVAQGRDPRAVIRDPDRAVVELPTVDRRKMLTAPTTEEILERHRYWNARGITGPYIYQAGQPTDVRRAYYRAMGLDDHGGAP